MCIVFQYRILIFQAFYKIPDNFRHFINLENACNTHIYIRMKIKPKKELPRDLLYAKVCTSNVSEFHVIRMEDRFWACDPSRF
jgi:hypothetical protein